MAKIGFGDTPSSPAIVVGTEEEQQVNSRYHSKARASLSLPRYFESGRPMSAAEMDEEVRRKSVSFQEQKQYHSWDEDELHTQPVSYYNDSSSSDMSSLPTRIKKRPAGLLLDEEDWHPRRGSSGMLGTKNMKNRSRSVIIRLQVPRHSPTVHRKLLSGESSGETDIGQSDGRTRALTYSGSPSPKLSRRRIPKTVDAATDVVSNLNEDESDDEICDLSPTMSRSSQIFSSRRNSFLYQSDTDDAPSTALTRSTSLTSYLGDETYVTPFAQILAILHRVRSHFITLTHPPIPDERRKSGLWEPSAHTDLNEDEYKALSLSTLDDLDWCLHKLETVNSAKSMGTMAQDKFKRLLSRELSHLSERSQSGHFVAEWVNRMTGSSEDRGEEIDKALESLSIVDTSLGLDARGRSTSVTDSSMSRFGITAPSLNDDQLQEFIDTNMERWEFDAFQLNYLTVGQPLVAIAYTVFSYRGLFVEFKISKSAFVNFMSAVENNYLKQNPYHNAIHAADVLHAANYLLNASALEGIFSPLEVLALLIAAAVHDVDHPGRNNQFLINSNHDLAIMYNDESVLENHHLAVAFKLLQDPTCNFLDNLDRAQMKALRKIIIDTVLATDMKKHFQHLGELKTMVETKKVTNDGILQVDKYTERSEILQCLLHCSDLSNCTKPPSIASTWAYRIMEESFNQGDEEKKLGLDISPLGDRENVCVEKCQMSFIDFIIFPLWETWAELVYPDAQHILEHLAQTRDYWYRQSHSSPPLITNEDNDTPTNNPINIDVEKTLTPSSVDSQSGAVMSPPAQVRRLSFKATRNNAIADDDR